MNILGKAYSRAEFPAYLATLKWTAWKPSLVVIHHTAAPSLAQRPHGLLSEHLANIKWFYEHEAVGAPWSAGPHLFTDEDQIWTFSPLTARGIHAKSFNASGVGIEMLGDYDTEDPWNGRGREVLTTTCVAVKALLASLGLTPAAIRFHRDDPRTSKTCPGKKISREAFLAHLANV